MRVRAEEMTLEAAAPITPTVKKFKIFFDTSCVLNQLKKCQMYLNVPFTM